MRKRIASVLAAGGIAALTVGLGATATLASTPTWSVAPGGAVVARSTLVRIKDKTSKQIIHCKGSPAVGKLKKGTGLSGSGIGSFKSLAFKSCTGPKSLALTLSVTHFPVTMNVSKYIASKKSVDGSLAGIHFTISGKGCTATVDGTSATADNGTVDFAYHNSTAKMVLVVTGGNLKVYGVSGCSGLFKTGDDITLYGTYKLTPAQTIKES
jgi:hypothetical protein